MAADNPASILSTYLRSKLTNEEQDLLVRLHEMDFAGKDVGPCDDSHKPELPPQPWLKERDIYSTYKKPNNYIRINRSFLPTNMSPTELGRAYTNNLPENAPAEDLKVMNGLLFNLRNAVLELADTKLELHFSTAFWYEKYLLKAELSRTHWRLSRLGKRSQ